MDRLIRRFDAVRDDDLRLCRHRGIAYQRHMDIRAQYDAAYYAKCAAYDAAIASRVNAARRAFVRRHCGLSSLLDVGAGACQFVKAADCFGFDVNPASADALRALGRYSADFDKFEALTFWDVLEHVPEPHKYLQRIAPGAFVFATVPVFDDLDAIRASKHYRPDEHLYYFTRQGFIDWMALYGFRFLEYSDHEITAGRDSIGAFAFRRDLPQYRDMVGQYRQLHESRHYGASGSLYLEYLTPLVRALGPRSILDYGCGRSDLAAHFYADGRRRIARFDPAIAEYKVLPPGPFDLAFCIDVMEHIRMHDVDRVLGEIRERAPHAVFVISTKPARSKLPDGQNAHVTLLTKSEWTRWIASVFGKAEAVATQWEHVLLLKTF